jgi:hypothetical protein
VAEVPNKPKNARLTIEQMRFLLEAHARHEGWHEYGPKFADVFGIQISRQLAAQYDMDNPHFRDKQRRGPHSELVEYFFKYREEYLANKKAVPIANQVYRLKQIQRWYDREAAKPSPNPKLLDMWLEKGAKEDGGFFTNKRELSGPNGGPIATTATVDPDDYSSEAIRKILAILDGDTAETPDEG